MFFLMALSGRINSPKGRRRGIAFHVAVPVFGVGDGWFKYKNEPRSLQAAIKFGVLRVIAYKEEGLRDS